MSTFGFALAPSAPPRVRKMKNGAGSKMGFGKTGTHHSVYPPPTASDSESYSTDIGSSSSSSSAAASPLDDDFSGSVNRPANAKHGSVASLRRQIPASSRSSAATIEQLQKMNAAARSSSLDRDNFETQQPAGNQSSLHKRSTATNASGPRLPPQFVQEQLKRVPKSSAAGDELALDKICLTSHEERRRIDLLGKCQSVRVLQELFFHRGHLENLLQLWNRRTSETDISRLCLVALEHTVKMFALANQSLMTAFLLQKLHDCQVLKQILWSLETHFYRRDHQVAALSCLLYFSGLEHADYKVQMSMGRHCADATTSKSPNSTTTTHWKKIMQEFFLIQYHNIEDFRDCMLGTNEGDPSAAVPSSNPALPTMTVANQATTQSCYVIGHLVRGSATATIPGEKNSKHSFNGLSLLLLILRELVLRTHDGHTAKNGAFNCTEAEMAKIRVHIATLVLALFNRLLAPSIHGDMDRKARTKQSSAKAAVAAEHEEKIRLSFLAQHGLEIVAKTARQGFALVRSYRDILGQSGTSAGGTNVSVNSASDAAGIAPADSDHEADRIVLTAASPFLRSYFHLLLDLHGWLQALVISNTTDRSFIDQETEEDFSVLLPAEGGGVRPRGLEFSSSSSSANRKRSSSNSRNLNPSQAPSPSTPKSRQRLVKQVDQEVRNLFPSPLLNSPKNSPSPLKVWSDSEDDEESLANYLPTGVPRKALFGNKPGAKKQLQYFAKQKARDVKPPSILKRATASVSSFDPMDQEEPSVSFDIPASSNGGSSPQHHEFLSEIINSTQPQKQSKSQKRNIVDRFQDRMRRIPGGCRFLFELLWTYLIPFVQFNEQIPNLLDSLLQVVAVLLDTNLKNCDLFVENYMGLNCVISIFSLYREQLEKQISLENNLPNLQAIVKSKKSDAVKFLGCNFLNLAKVSETLPEKTQNLLLQCMPRITTALQDLQFEEDDWNMKTTRLQWLLDFIDEFFFCYEVQAMSSHFLVKFFQGRPFQRNSDTLALMKELQHQGSNFTTPNDEDVSSSANRSQPAYSPQPYDKQQNAEIDLIDVYGGEVRRKSQLDAGVYGAAKSLGLNGVIPNRANLDSHTDLALPQRTKISPAVRKRQFSYLLELFLTNCENFGENYEVVGQSLHALKLLLDADEEFRTACRDAIEVGEESAFDLQNNERLQVRLLEQALPALARHLTVKANAGGKKSPTTATTSPSGMMNLNASSGSLSSSLSSNKPPKELSMASMRTNTAVEYGLELMLLCPLSKTVHVAKLLELDLASILSAIIKENCVDVRLRFQVEKIHRSIFLMNEEEERKTRREIDGIGDAVANTGFNSAKVQRWKKFVEATESVDAEMARLVSNLVTEDEPQLFFQQQKFSAAEAKGKIGDSVAKRKSSFGTQASENGLEQGTKQLQKQVHFQASTAGGSGKSYNKSRLSFDLIGSQITGAANLEF
ncbi:unnamed protein product [Amoebophrya sp. A120]|nr:unnamed protein product [Amoebophrya sp. A120]|eukprot:GSA120T00003982001.1